MGSLGALSKVAQSCRSGRKTEEEKGSDSRAVNAVV